MKSKQRLWKAVLSSVLAGSVLLSSSIPHLVFASEQTSGQMAEQEIDIKTVEMEPVGTEISMQKLPEQHLTVIGLDETGKPNLNAGNYLNWYDRLADLPDYAKNFHEWLIEHTDGDSIDDSQNPCGTDWMLDPTKGTELSEDVYVYPVTSFTWTETFKNIEAKNGETLKAAIEAYLEEQTKDVIMKHYQEALQYITAVYAAFDRDHPEIFWLSGNHQIEYGVSYQYSYDEKGSGTAEYTQNIYFCLKSDSFDVRAENYQDVEYIRSKIAEQNQQVTAILSGMNDTEQNTVYQKVLYFNDWLTKNNAYNSSKDLNTINHDCREAISALNGRNGEAGPICEGYARAFKVLCDKAGISCTLVNGNAYTSTNPSGEAHMWNLVGDEKNNYYAVDVTWNDPVISDGGTEKDSGLEHTNYLMVGSETEIDGMKFSASHQITNQVISEGVAFVNQPTMQTKRFEELQDIIYVSENGKDSNTGLSADAAVKTIEQALELVKEGGTIQILNTAVSEQPSEDEPLLLTKKVTIKGGELTLSRAGIVLGADAALEDISLTFKNPVRNAIIANGYTLTLKNVKKSKSCQYPIHLFCGEVTGYSGKNALPKPGSQGAVIISGTENELGDIFAGSLSEYKKANEWNGNTVITISKDADGTIGSVYAHGATEPRGEGDGSGMTPDSSLYRVNGTVKINLSGSAPAVVDGLTGGEKKADVVWKGGSYPIDNLSFQNLNSLTVSSGTLKPKVLNEKLDVSIASGAELDLSAVIPENASFAVNHFAGGGTLVMGEKNQLCIMGTVTGTTAFQTIQNRPMNKSTSGTVEVPYAYIDVTNATGDGSFTFTPHYTQKDIVLAINRDADTAAWMTFKDLESAEVKPISFEIPAVSYTMLLDEVKKMPTLDVPVNCELKEGDSIYYVPLNIAVSKDGKPAIEAKIDDETGNYCVAELGFESIALSEGAKEEEAELNFEFNVSAIQPGNYQIAISVMLSDNSIVTKHIDFTVKQYEKLAGYTLSLNGNIGVNFYMELSDTILQDKNAYMLFTLPNGKTETMLVTEAEKKPLNSEDKTYYVFPCEAASYEMTRAIKIQIFDGKGNGTTEYSYTVRDYAEYIINHPSDYSQGDIDFAKAMLNYGACSQSYFNVAVNDLANKNLDAAEQRVPILAASDLAEYRKLAKSNALGTFTGYSLTLKSETTLKAYFKPAEGVDVSQLTFTANKQKVTPVLSGEYYILSVDKIKAWDLDKDYSFKVSKDGTELEFACSALSYAYSVLNKGSSTYSETLLQLISALRVYQQKSEFYVSGND